MKKWFSTPLAAAVMAAALIGGPAAIPAVAQGAAQGLPGGQNPGAMIQELMKGLNLGPMMMSFGGAGGGMIDFTRSNERNLLKRADVRSELFIDSKQREQLANLETQGKQQMQQVVMQSAMKAFVNNPDLANIGESIKNSGNGAPPDLTGLKDALNTGFQQMQESLQVFQAGQDEKSEAVLRPKQLKRLHELDLQYRGLLALSERKVADSLKVTQDQRTVVEGALKDYMDAQMKAMQPIMNQAAQLGQQAATNGGQPPAGFNPQAIQKNVNDLLNSDELKKARAAAEDKVKASLTPEQRTAWTGMLGQKFVFRVLETK
jgi:predicted lipid-binding transport protein (Tim44 family)